MFYTYIHRYQDTGKVFYVGMSKNKSRMTSKHRSHQPKWHEAVANREWVAEMVATWNTKEEAESHEKLLIECFIDLSHPLVNLTKGGAGRNGFRWTEEERQRMIPIQQARGRKGGQAKSEAKTLAVRRNGALGGQAKRLG
jgi:predicted GIY-YIG superfamily endonuclease